ncbi:MAG: outer membrane lipoprotein-sorting protein, partial [Elusimicrobia bacterium]|nr:outer membrane lipoprotein-sorting protein [Elusimicrobiota bacterium]
DDRWMFIPALNMTQRIAAHDAGSSFVGSDFTYEDVSGRDIEADAHKIIKEEELDGKSCWVIESVPKNAASYKRKLSWIEKSGRLPLKDEYYDVQDQLFKVFLADEIKEVDGIPTVVKRTMKNVKTGHQSVVELTQVHYRLALKPEAFNERSLKSPPKEWIK